MPQVQANVAALLDVARDLSAQERFDADVVLELLERLQLVDLDVQSHGAVTHARLVATTALSERSSRDAVARFALARVVTLLERHIGVVVLTPDHGMQDARTARQPS